nr:bcl-2-like protein 10 [Anolis sagrei ordinatus]
MMPLSLREETALLVGDYLERRVGLAPAGRAPGRAGETLRRVAEELERRERHFFRCAAASALPETGGQVEAAALVWRVAAQMEEEEAGGGGLNWGRVVALVVFAGNVAVALAERGQGPAQGQATREGLSEALAAYLAEEKRAWMVEHGGWDGFYHFFNKHGSNATDHNSTISNAIMAAAGFGLAGLAFLLAVR